MVFEREHSIADELAWLDSEGPASPALVRLRRTGRVGLRLRALLQLSLLPRLARRARPPQARRCSCRRRSAIRRSACRSSGPIFRGVRGRHVQLAGRAGDDPGGDRQHATCPASWSASAPKCRSAPIPARFRQAFDVQPPVRDLHRPHRREQGLRRAVSTTSSATPRTFPRGLDLRARSATPVMPIPDAPAHPPPRVLSRSRQVRRARRRGPADHAVVLREPVDGRARGVGARPAGARQRRAATCCKGQCIRSSAGLYYESYEEFVEALYALESNGPLHARLGRNGRDFFTRHYAWPVIERQVPRHVRGGSSGSRRKRRWSRCPASSRGGGAIARPQRSWPRRSASGAGARCRGRPRGAHDGPRPGAARPPGARDARVRRRHRPRGARHPARAPRRGLRVGDLRRDGRPAPRGPDDSTIARWSATVEPRRRAHPSLLDRIARVAHGLRPAGADGARLPQHHAARVLHRRPQAIS